MPRPLKKGSCNTCRRRKVRCDESVPVCQRCTKSSRYCDRSERATQFRQSSSSSPSAVGPWNRAHGLRRPESPRKALEDQNIARLYSHYICNLSPWYDLSDSALNFGILVPERALDEPLLFCAIVALSAMHIGKTTARSFRSTAESHHGRCIRLLIDLEEGDGRVSSGVALAATCLLRSYEILETNVDSNMHLRGAYSIASLQSLLSGGLYSGLLAAGFWNYLREDITFSLFENCSLKSDLESTPPLQEHCSDQDYLNSISLVLARIINMSFDHSMTATEWGSAFEMIQRWFLDRPTRFQPISRGNGIPGRLQSLPSIWHLQPCHTSAMHYYLVALTILVMQAPSGSAQDVSSLVPVGLDRHGSPDDLIELLALDICGSTFTVNTPSVTVNAFGPMAYCAKRIRAEASRHELTRQLVACGTTIGWPVTRLIDDLESSWKTL